MVRLVRENRPQNYRALSIGCANDLRSLDGRSRVKLCVKMYTRRKNSDINENTQMRFKSLAKSNKVG